MTEEPTSGGNVVPSADGKPDGATAPSADEKPGMTAVRFEYTPNFAQLLAGLGGSLLVSTYQAGKLVAIGSAAGALDFSFHGFEQVMGIAIGQRKIAVGSRRQIWILRSEPEFAPRLKPPGKYDGCYLARVAHQTGEMHGHEMAWLNDELWVVNTLFSCLCTIDERYSFAPQWRPPFISALASEDRCHLNGMAVENGKPRYVTAMAETDTAAGWRPDKATTGVVIDVASGMVVARGFAMPHSPRLHDGKLWVLDSGNGRLSVVDRASGKVEPVAHFPGYTRGLAFVGPFAFIGLSRIRETAVFSGIPIAENRENLRCGVAVLDLRNGQTVAGLRFHSGVEEIFDVQFLPGIRLAAMNGPNPNADGHETIWIAPSDARPTAAPHFSN